jgi:hypothetical protein
MGREGLLFGLFLSLLHVSNSTQVISHVSLFSLVASAVESFTVTSNIAYYVAALYKTDI